ncbi:hypothetical protein E4K63_04085 [Allofrancisella inopinata]|uniref:Uncharacterized protein n=1 Tax=Allofrancisella inopinata TaxID=1085647 RepID=A0AAE6YHS5_9GAMM|nr:hypothetical protein [Allofrancisella inopinata]QIV96050.1 hypothetical protein E4K63_04085 [Allofrancisella inopinata]
MFKQNISIKQQKFCNNIEELIQHIIKKVLEIYNIDAYHNGSFATSTDYENYTYHNFVNNRNNSEKLLYNSHYKDMKSFIKSHNQGKNKYSSFDCIDCGNIIMMYIAYLKSKYLLYNIEAAQVHINANYSADFLHPIEYGGSHRIIVVTNKSEGKNKSFYNNLDCLKNDKDTYIIDILNKDNQYFSSIENVYCWVPDRLEGSFYSIKSAKEFSIEVISTLEEMLNYDGDYVQQKPSLCNIF